MCAVSVFGVASLLALAGADWPPPPGFLWLEVLLAGASSAVYLRVRSRLATRWSGRWTPPAALEGLLAGLTAGLLMMMVSPAEPTVVPTAGDRVTWLLVTGLTGALAAQAVWGVAVAAAGRPPPKTP
jgi:hypothetical protein